MKEFSIIIATKDRNKSIERLFNSMNSTHFLKRKDIEIIVIDNNTDIKSSTTLEILCKKYRLKYSKEIRSGKSYAISTGIKLSEGKYFVIIDDDAEIIDNTWIDKLKLNFLRYPRLGYASGNVLAKSTESKAQLIWEKKGGLSKGSVYKYFSTDYINTFKISPIPLSKIFAGCNSMISRDVIKKVGGYNYFFNHGNSSTIGHGDSLESGYRLINAGYAIVYDPKAIVLHNHPKEEATLKKKLFYYGRGDSALHLYLFFKYFDFRCLFWALGGHQLYIFKNLIKSLMGNYALPSSYVIQSLVGSVIGPYVFLDKYLIFKLKGNIDYEKNIFCDNK